MPSFQKIIDILSNAFSILDFSYIVSGGFTLGIVLFDLHYHYYVFFIRNISITIVCGIFLAYICGLSSWIIGRLIRKIVQNTDKDFEETYDRTMNALASNALSLSVSDKKLAYSYYKRKNQSFKNSLHYPHSVHKDNLFFGFFFFM